MSWSLVRASPCNLDRSARQTCWLLLYTYGSAGASSGIGEACALRFAEAGCKLIITARRTDRLTDLSERLQSRFKVHTGIPAENRVTSDQLSTSLAQALTPRAFLQAKVHLATLDVTNLEQVQRFQSGLPDEFSEVSILVNNAGLALGTSPVHEYTPEVSPWLSWQANACLPGVA